ncbi:MAG: histone deacetylase [Gemmatimonadota bacterium]|nr:MAG: histone deacetylase [Gemmatimonadota bacterium]
MASHLSVIWHPAYEVDIGPHVFPTQKYGLVRDRLLEDHTLTTADFVTAEPASDEQVGLVHSAEFIGKIKTGDFSLEEQMILEVPFSTELREAMWLCAGGSIITARRALESGIAAHLGGGFHHAFPNHGEGFCLINDVAIAIRALLHDGSINRAAVIDCDVHHGNGTAAIFADEPAVFTFSMHQEHNYPPWKPPSDLDLGLANGTGDEQYLKLLSRHLPEIIQRHRPDLVFFLAGADPYRHDQLGGLGLTFEGLRMRDGLVFDTCWDASVPVALTLAGGYAIRQDDTVEIHCNTVREAARKLRGQHRLSDS